LTESWLTESWLTVRLTRASFIGGGASFPVASREVRTMDATARLPVVAVTLAFVAANGWPRPGAADAFAPGEAPVNGGTRLPGTPPTPMVLRSPGYAPEASRW